MSSGTRVFVKILIAVVSYGIAFALAFYAVNQILNGHDSFLTIVILIIIAIFGFRANQRLTVLLRLRGRNRVNPCHLVFTGPKNSIFYICRCIYCSLDDSEETFGEDKIAWL